MPFPKGTYGSEKLTNIRTEEDQESEDVHGNADVDTVEAEAVIGADGQMKTKADTSRPYQGDVPYVVLAVDGRSRSPQLDGFALKAAEASLLERFMKTGSLSQAVLRDLDTALGFFNDFSFRQKVNEIDDALKKPGLTPEEIKALNDARGAYVKNIRSKEFQP